jgi:N utilization substance protein B
VDKQAIRAKQKARQLLVQALYQWGMADTPIAEIESQFHAVHDMSRVDAPYFKEILYGVATSLTEIETTLRPFLDRNIESLNPVEAAVLRMGTYELLFCLEIPYRIVLDEAVSLAKRYGSQDGHRYVNGVLHHLAKQVRAIEQSLPDDPA